MYLYEKIPLYNYTTRYETQVSLFKEQLGSSNLISYFYPLLFLHFRRLKHQDDYRGLLLIVPAYVTGQANSISADYPILISNLSLQVNLLNFFISKMSRKEIQAQKDWTFVPSSTPAQLQNPIAARVVRSIARRKRQRPTRPAPRTIVPQLPGAVNPLEQEIKLLIYMSSIRSL